VKSGAANRSVMLKPIAIVKEIRREIMKILTRRVLTTWHSKLQNYMPDLILKPN
jgi:hypothetical protein